MKKIQVFILSVSLILSGCSTMSKTLKGGLLGGGAGAVVGAGVGALIGKSATSAAIGAGIGTAVGAATGTIIGNKMDKAAAQAAKIEGAKVDSIRDANNLKALKVTFDSGILFATNSAEMQQQAKTNIADAIKLYLEDLAAEGEDIPNDNKPTFVGRIEVERPHIAP